MTAVTCEKVRRCSECGAVAVCDCVTCPACHRARLRVLTAEEVRTWEQVESEGEELAARAVAVRCGMLEE